jgi:hypothetical protein
MDLIFAATIDSERLTAAERVCKLWRTASMSGAGWQTIGPELTLHNRHWMQILGNHRLQHTRHINMVDITKDVDGPDTDLSQMSSQSRLETIQLRTNQSTVHIPRCFVLRSLHITGVDRGSSVPDVIIPNYCFPALETIVFHGALYIDLSAFAAPLLQHVEVGPFISQFQYFSRCPRISTLHLLLARRGLGRHEFALSTVANMVQLRHLFLRLDDYAASYYDPRDDEISGSEHLNRFHVAHRLQRLESLDIDFSTDSSSLTATALHSLSSISSLRSLSFATCVPFAVEPHTLVALVAALSNLQRLDLTQCPWLSATTAIVHVRPFISLSPISW